jgi:acetyltransferase
LANVALAVASTRNLRVLGPHSFGIVRTDIGLNATAGSAAAHAGRLALVAQSGAVCAAMLDFAASVGIGFSTVAALGGAMDVGFGDLLDALVVDPHTDGILLYAEAIGDARRFLSALRAAARTKPVVVLRAGVRWSRFRRCAIARCGLRRGDEAVRHGAVKTYTPAVCRGEDSCDASNSRGDRIAIVTNGHGPEHSRPTAPQTAASRSPSFRRRRENAGSLLPRTARVGNPIDVRDDARRKRWRAQLKPHFATRRVMRFSRCTFPSPSSAPPMPRVRSRRWRRVRRNRCWRRGSGRSIAAKPAQRSKRGRRQLLHA